MARLIFVDRKGMISLCMSVCKIGFMIAFIGATLVVNISEMSLAGGVPIKPAIIAPWIAGLVANRICRMGQD